MSTSISWTQETWNPITGCSKVSPGCAHCYAEALSLRRGWSKLPWTPENAKANVVLHEDRLRKPESWKQPRMVFVNSMSDLFHELVPTLFIGRVMNIMASCQQHTFQVLTKRPERMAAVVQTYTEMFCGGQPLANVWWGTSVENQHFADERIPWLIEVPAVVRFLSCEPLLGPVDIGRYLGFVHEDALGIVYPDPRSAFEDGWPSPWCRGVDWVIAGGESGPQHRPMDIQWARDLRDQCQAAGVAFFFKQSSGFRPETGKLLDGVEYHEYPKVEMAKSV